MDTFLFEGENYNIFITGKLKKANQKQRISNFIILDYVLYWYEGRVKIFIKNNKKTKEIKFRTQEFRDYWTDEILSLANCFIYFEQKSDFYKRFYEDSDFEGIKENKFCLLIDLVVEDLLSQIDKMVEVVCPHQFRLLDLVNKGICYKNKYPLESCGGY